MSGYDNCDYKDERIAELEKAKKELAQIGTGLYAAVKKLGAEVADLQDGRKMDRLVLEAENKRLLKVVEAAEKMITEGYADSFSNWVCPSEYAFPVEAALQERGDE